MKCRSSIQKARKANIPKAIKEQVWLKSFGEVFKHKCYVHWCDNNINTFDFHVGHDKPESEGGTLAVSNLKPICARCNLSMSDKYTIKEWQDLTPLKEEKIEENSIPHKLRRKKFMNCF